MAGSEQYRAADFIEAIKGSGGIITKIAARVGCSWHTAKKYIDNYATVQQAYQDECEKVLDMAESVVIKKITEEDEQTAKWYLGMKGGKRGYATKHRIEDVRIDLATLSDEQLERIANGEDPVDVILSGSRSSRT